MTIGARYFRHTAVNCTRPAEADEGIPYSSAIKLAMLAVGLAVALLHIALLSRQCRHVLRSTVFYLLCIAVVSVFGVLAILPIVLREFATQFNLVALHALVAPTMPYSFGTSSSYNVALTYIILMLAIEASLSQYTHRVGCCRSTPTVRSLATSCTQWIDTNPWYRYVAVILIIGVSLALCSFVFGEVVVMYKEGCTGTLSYTNMLNDLMQRSDFMHFTADAYAPIAWYIPLCVTVALYLPHLLHWCDKRLYRRCIKGERQERIAKDEHHASRLLTEAMIALAIQTLLTVMPESAAAWALNMPAHAKHSARSNLYPIQSPSNAEEEINIRTPNSCPQEDVHVALEICDHMFHVAHALRVLVFMKPGACRRRRSDDRGDCDANGEQPNHMVEFSIRL